MRISDWSSDVCSSDLARICLESLFQRRPAVGREAEAEGAPRRLRNPALRQVIARRGAVRTVELLREPVGGGLRHVAQARLRLGLLGGARVGGRDLPPRLGGKLLDRVHERQRSEEHPSELQSLMRISYALLCLQKKK